MKINGFISTAMLTVLLLIATLGEITHAENEKDWMPDPNLQQVVRETLDIPDTIPMFPADIASLTHLVAENNIKHLKGLEHAISLKFLHIGRSEVLDLTALTELENLQTLKLFDNRISDISPLSGLINMEFLQLQNNQISDLTPLANLQNLRVLHLEGNHISDVSPLSGLTELQELILGRNFISDFTPLVSLTNLRTLHIYPNPIPSENQFIGMDISHLKAAEESLICVKPIPSYTTSVTERINNRDYPSAFLTHKRGDDPEQYPDTFDQFVRYDFSFMFEPFHPIARADTFNSPFSGTVRIGSPHLSQVHTDAIRENPNMIFIVEIAYFDGRFLNLPDDSPYWFRNKDGSIAIREWSVDPFGNVQEERLVNFTHPDVIEMLIQRTVAIAKCGLYDGIWLDRWHPDFGGELSHLVSPEAERNARLQILQGIRANVRDDFLIIINSREEIPHFAPYINGVFIEAHEPNPIYTYKDLYRFENLIEWYESNLREPAFTLLWGQAAHKPPRSQRVMRLFTTLSLTHSDGYVSVSSEPHPLRTYYYDFWDALLGQPVGGDETKGQLYKTPKGISIDGLFIREFTNGWAVYNRSGKERKIYFSEKVSGVASGVVNKHWHTVPDLDGEIFLKQTTPTTEPSIGTQSRYDVDDDGDVDVSDVRLVVLALGQKDKNITNPRTDVNEDNKVDKNDVLLVIDNLDDANGAPLNTHLLSPISEETMQLMNPTILRSTLEALYLENDGSLKYQQAIVYLEHLLAAIRPDATQLLANYPNPFNPETWIPYHLANPSNVQITIYDARGSIVRQLNLGHQREGYYTSRSRAAYWDGRNSVGERVASGVYFYQLQADGLSYLRKMVIVK